MGPRFRALRAWQLLAWGRGQVGGAGPGPYSRHRGADSGQLWSDSSLGRAGSGAPGRDDRAHCPPCDSGSVAGGTPQLWVPRCGSSSTRAGASAALLTAEETDTPSRCPESRVCLRSRALPGLRPECLGSRVGLLLPWPQSARLSREPVALGAGWGAGVRFGRPREHWGRPGCGVRAASSPCSLAVGVSVPSPCVLSCPARGGSQAPDAAPQPPRTPRHGTPSPSAPVPRV